MKTRLERIVAWVHALCGARGTITATVEDDHVLIGVPRMWGHYDTHLVQTMLEAKTALGHYLLTRNQS